MGCAIDISAIGVNVDGVNVDGTLFLKSSQAFCSPTPELHFLIFYLVFTDL